MNDTREATFLERVERFLAEDGVARYDPWTYDAPLVCDEGRVRELEALQEAMLALAEGVASHFDALLPHLPYDGAVKGFFAKLAGKPMRAGAFRPDFLVTEDGHLWLFEITCRFPLNGTFLSEGCNQLPKIRRYIQDHQLESVGYTRKLVQTLLAWAGQADALWIIRGRDSARNESSALQPHFDGAMPLPFVYISLEDFIALDPSAFAGTKALVAEINFEEWQRIPDTHLEAMLEGPLLNDPRFVFITHDKSFFALPFMEEIASTVLSDQEARLLRKHFAKTLLPGQAPEAWENALQHPERWIIKPRRLGKSEGIVAGALADYEAWKALIERAEHSDVVLQQWHEPRRIEGSIGDREYEDVFCGTWLCWGHESLGPGLIRASTHKVINVKDNRKAACIVAPRFNDARDASIQWL